MNIDSADRPERVEGQRVTSGLFAALGVQPLLGRYYMPREDQPDIDPQPVVVISYGLRQRRFGGDPDVVGQKIPIEATMSMILGVMPRVQYRSENGCRHLFAIHSAIAIVACLIPALRATRVDPATAPRSG